jgi:hypothetical protein
MELEVLKDQYGFLSLNWLFSVKSDPGGLLELGQMCQKLPPKMIRLAGTELLWSRFILAALPQETGKGLFSRELIKKAAVELPGKKKAIPVPVLNS